MNTAKIFKLSDAHAGLSNVFIHIKDKRTPHGNFFFRLDKLECVSIISNSGLTVLLEVADGYLDPCVTYETFMSFIIQVFEDISESDNSIKIYELIADDETVREIPSRTIKTISPH